MDYERQTGGHVGLYAENLETGARLAWRADERFVMCSSFKASLAACVLAHVDRGREMILEVIASLEDIAKVEKPPAMEGRNMTAVLIPK